MNEIIELVDQGYNNIEIMNELEISHSTVLRNIRRYHPNKINPNPIYKFDHNQVKSITEDYFLLGTKKTCEKNNLSIKRLRRIITLARMHNLGRTPLYNRAKNFDDNLIQILQFRHLVRDFKIYKHFHMSGETYYRKLKKLGILKVNLVGMPITTYQEMYSHHKPEIKIVTLLQGARNGVRVLVPWFYLSETKLATPKIIMDYYKIMALFQRFIHGPDPIKSIEEKLNVFRNYNVQHGRV